jgi:deoxycytidine triphosphate deaminase
MSKKEETKTSSEDNTAQSGIELLTGRELEHMFGRNFDQGSLDNIGYDVRLGDVVRLITSGEERTLNEGESVEIFPGETVVAKTEEILSLPEQVFALGSPKMSLIGQGLWAHGGKTDPGFNQPLTLGFMNVGNKSCTLARGQKIFHLTFFRINGKRIGRYAGRGINLPSTRSSPLDENIELNKDVLKRVMECDGIHSYRICRYLYNTQRSSKRTSRIVLFAMVTSNIIAAAFGFLWLTGSLTETSVYGFVGVLLTETIINGILLGLQSFPSLFKRKE